jgi:hypothetical protein
MNIVSKSTGRPRGRPRKAIPKVEEKRNPGRPKLDPMADPDRYWVALIRAMTGLGIASERSCAEVVAALVGAKEISSEATPDGRIAVLYESVNFTFAGRYTTYKHKLDRKFKTDEEANWHLAMTHAFNLVLRAKHPLDLHTIINLASAVGEFAFAKQFLIPMATARISGHFNMQDKPPA